MQPQRRRICLMGCVGLIGLFAVGMWLALRPGPSPMDHALAVAQTTQWLPGARNPSFVPSYYWSAGDELTYFCTGTDGKPHLYRRSATTGMDAPGREGPAVHLQDGYVGQLSRDGKWYVEWNPNALHQRVPTFIAMDGTQQQVGRSTLGTEGVWGAGNHPVMFCGVWGRSAVIDIYHPDSASVQRMIIPGLAHFDAPQCVDSSGRLVGFKDNPNIAPFKLSAQLVHQKFEFMEMVRVDPAHPDSKPDQWNVAIPRNAGLGICRVAPSGDRLLWLVQGDTTPAIVRKLRSLIPGLRPSFRISNRWLVSGLRGENMHEIAAYRDDPVLSGEPIRYTLPLWMPDSKHISFVHENILYTRPVD